MELTERDLEMIATSLGKTCDAVSRKARRMTGAKRREATDEFHEHENLRRRIVDEQEVRFKASA
jgi:hypothetical protein